MFNKNFDLKWWCICILRVICSGVISVFGWEVWIIVWLIDVILIEELFWLNNVCSNVCNEFGINIMFCFEVILIEDGYIVFEFLRFMILVFINLVVVFIIDSFFFFGFLDDGFL